MTTERTLAQRLLDAQVSYVLDQLSAERLHANIARDVDEVLAIAAQTRLDALVSAEDVARIVRRLLETVPSSVAASTFVEAGADVIHDGSDQPVSPSDLIAREHVEALVEEVLALHPLVERSLDRLTDSPLVGTLAARFLSKIVVDVLQANRTAAERIPGVSSIVSLGTNAASKAIGLADKPLQLVGDTAGKGAAFAVRRLNRVVIETLQDPLLGDAVMEVWDQHADEPMEDLDGFVAREDVRRIAGLLQEIVIAGAPSEPVVSLVDALIGAFFAVYGEYPVTTLLEELEITRDDLVRELQILLPRAVAAAQADGHLERAIRARLEPFFHSAAVTELLAGRRDATAD